MMALISFEHLFVIILASTIACTVVAPSNCFYCHAVVLVQAKEWNDLFWLNHSDCVRMILCLPPTNNEKKIEI